MENFSSLLKSFYEKKRKKTRLSMRRLAQMTSVSPALMSMILNGKRQPSIAVLEDLCRILDIDQESGDELKLGLLQNKNLLMSKKDLPLLRSREVRESKESPFELAEEAQFISLKSWHYFAILQTTLLKEYDGTEVFIARFLGLNATQTGDMIQELLNVKLLEKDSVSGSLRKTHRSMLYQSRNKEMLRRHHVSCLDKAIQTLKNKNTEYNMQNRLITSSAFTCSSKDIPLLKQQIAQFIKQIANSDETQGHDEVCQFSIQLFPLSNR